MSSWSFREIRPRRNWIRSQAENRYANEGVHSFLICIGGDWCLRGLIHKEPEEGKYYQRRPLERDFGVSYAMNLSSHTQNSTNAEAREGTILMIISLVDSERPPHHTFLLWVTLSIATSRIKLLSVRNVLNGMDDRLDSQHRDAFQEATIIPPGVTLWEVKEESSVCLQDDPGLLVDGRISSCNSEKGTVEPITTAAMAEVPASVIIMVVALRILFAAGQPCKMVRTVRTAPGICDCGKCGRVCCWHYTICRCE